MTNTIFKNLVSPKRLQPGSTIGVIAPSAGNANFFPHRAENAQRFLEDQGYKVKYATHALENRDYVSGDAEARASDVHEMFSDPEVSAIICTIGGNHSNQLLKYLDFDLIKNNPKIFLGYSDISVLHYAFMTKAQLRTFYGPCLMTQFGEHPKPLSYTLDLFSKAVEGTEPIGNIEASDEWTSEILDWSKKDDLTRPRKLLPSEGYSWLRQGEASGSIIGGCVPSINHLAGTDYWIDPAGCIFFIDIPEGHKFGAGLSISELDSYFADLDNLGVFKTITGLIIGRPYNYSSEQADKLAKLIESYTTGNDYPILLNANIGHTDPIITLPMGVQATLQSEENRFSIDESGVK